eukprot:1143979-Pelagomonas_calceolata.AAC.1
MIRKIALLLLFGLLELQVLSLVIVLACWAAAASRVGKKRVVIRAGFKCNKVDFLVLRRDLVGSRSSKGHVINAAILPHNGQRAEVKDILNMMACWRGSVLEQCGSDVALCCVCVRTRRMPIEIVGPLASVSAMSMVSVSECLRRCD